MQDTALAQYAAIIAGSMPKQGSLSPAAKQLLLDWLNAGAPGVPLAACP